MAPQDARVILVSEARGEFLMVERIRQELSRLGRESLHVTASSNDASVAELTRSAAVALDDHPAVRAAAGLPAARLAPELERVERAAGNVSLRRVWQADLRSWREGHGDDAMARLAIGYVDAWRAVLHEAGAVAGVWGEEGGHLAKRTAFLVAREAAIRVWFVVFLPLPGRMLVLEDPLFRLGEDELRTTSPEPSERRYAEDLVASIRDSRVQFATPRSLAFHPRRVARFASLVARRARNAEPGAESLYPWTFARLYTQQRAVSAVLARVYRPLGSAPFVFYPIHYRTDAQITIRAPQWENQLALIELLSDSLPYGFELAIKEHPYEPGGMPAGGLLALLRRRRNVRLLPPSIHSHEILRRAAALVTVNSTVGFEALFFGVPVVTLGNGPYRGLGLTYDVGDAFDLPQALWDAVHGPPPSDDEVLSLITLLHRRSYPGSPLGYDVSDENIRAYASMFAALADR